MDNNLRGKAGDYTMKKVFFVFSLIFSLLFINGKEYYCETKEDSFRNIEKVIMENCEFVENGLKLEYTTSLSVDDEYKRILSLLSPNNKFKVVQENNHLRASIEEIEYNIHIYTSYNITRVDMIAINKKKDTSLEYIKQKLQNLRRDNYLDERYFCYVKGRLKTDKEELSSNINKELKIDTLNTLEINNGIIAKAVMKDDREVNIGQINYDTGSYLIIGTPMIFITY